ncbi:hypothetical protein Aperf_G00000095889 [Anoplocephala perfoliata]
MRRLTAVVVGPLLLLLCVEAFAQSVTVNFNPDSDANMNGMILTEGMDTMTPEAIQKAIDDLPRIDDFIRHFDTRSLSAIIIRVPNLDENLLRLKNTTLAFIHRKVDENTRQYLYRAAPQAMNRFFEYIAPERHDDAFVSDRREGYYGRKRVYPDFQKLYGEQPPQGFNEVYQNYPEYQENIFPQDPCSNLPGHHTLRQPPYGIAEMITFQYPYGYPHKGQQSYGFDEMKRREHQVFPQGRAEHFYRYPRRDLLVWPEPPDGNADQWPFQYPYRDYQCPQEGQQPYYSDELGGNQNQDGLQSREEPSFQYPGRDFPVWPQPPDGIVGQSPSQFPCRGYECPYEEQQPYFEEMDPKQHQDCPQWQDGLLFQKPHKNSQWTEQHQPPCVMDELSPIEDPCGDYQFPDDEEVPDDEFYELEPGEDLDCLQSRDEPSSQNRCEHLPVESEQYQWPCEDCQWPCEDGETLFEPDEFEPESI